MNVINASVRPNGILSYELECRRSYDIDTAAIKRRSNRQLRRDLKADLRLQIDAVHRDAAEAAATRRVYDRWSNDMKKMFDVAPQVEPVARVPHQVQVVRKLAGSPFARKQVKVMTLAA
jgi:hypothetical protein